MTVGSWPSGFSAHTGTIYIAIPAYRSTIPRLFLETIIDKTFETEVVRSWWTVVANCFAVCLVALVQVGTICNMITER
jgi:hypothetical protein